MTERKTPDDAPRPAYLAREIDAAAMKAFAHPLRMRMYEYLNEHEAATATTLARHTGESTGQTSYHLRQLERHGFVTEDPDRGTGRERWWKSVGFSVRGQDLARDSGTRPAVEVMLRHQIEQRGHDLAAWFARSEQEDPAWIESSTDARVTTALTPGETRLLAHDLMQLIHEHTERAKRLRAAGEGEDARRVRVYLDVFPLAPED